MQTAARIGLLIGSSRIHGNNPGIASWVEQCLDAHLNPSGTSKKFEIIVVNPTTPPHPFGPVTNGDRLPAQVTDPLQYDSEAIRDWSRFVSSCSAFVVVTPQYNGGYPGELKNSIDHLYREWTGKPVMIVAFGGHGGNKCAAQLQTVFNQLKMQVLPEPVCIWLPGSYIRGDDRVPSGRDFPDFLASYSDAVNIAADQLKELLAATVSKEP
jgi:NAD(P)H-dependent FMN reductase